MKKVSFMIMMILLITLIFSACQKGNIGASNPKSDLPVATSPTELPQIASYKLVDNQTQINEEVEIKSLVEKFISQRPIASNSNSFSLITDTMEKNSQMYKILELEIGYMFDRGIKMNLLSYEVKNIIRDDSLNVYRVLTNEKIELKYSKIDLVISNFAWVYTVKKLNDNFLLIGIDAGEDTATSEKMIKLMPTMKPEKIQNDKFEMVKAAMDGILAYLDVDYKKQKKDYKNIGCGFAFGPNLSKLLAGYEERKLQIENKKLTIKVISSEVSGSSHTFDEGNVTIYFKLEINENGVIRLEDFVSTIYLLNMGVDAWYIENIAPLSTI